jgi:hypothetical protein
MTQKLEGYLQNCPHLYFCNVRPQPFGHRFMHLAYLTPPPPPIYTAEIVTKWVCVGGAIQERVWVHCPNSGPHFTLYTTYTKDAFLYREKNSATVVMLHCENFYLSPVGTHDPGIIFLLLLKLRIATGHNFLSS